MDGRTGDLSDKSPNLMQSTDSELRPTDSVSRR